MPAEDSALKAKVVNKLLRKRVTGGKNRTIDTVKNWFASSDQGRVEDLIDEMVTDPSVPVERYGGTRNAIRLTSIQAGKEYVESLGHDPPWGL